MNRSFFLSVFVLSFIMYDCGEIVKIGRGTSMIDSYQLNTTKTNQEISAFAENYIEVENLIIKDLTGIQDAITSIEYRKGYLDKATLDYHKANPSMGAYWIPKDIPKRCIEHVVFSENDISPIKAHKSDYGDPRKIILDTLKAIHMEAIPLKHPEIKEIIASSYPNFNNEYNRAAVMASRHISQEEGEAFFYCLEKLDDEWQITYKNKISYWSR